MMITAATCGLAITGCDRLDFSGPPNLPSVQWKDQDKHPEMKLEAYSPFEKRIFGKYTYWVSKARYSHWWSNDNTHDFGETVMGIVAFRNYQGEQSLVALPVERFEQFLFTGDRDLLGIKDRNLEIDTVPGAGK
jgi:hypothetical protein